jgi:hypothetical protein
VLILSDFYEPNVRSDALLQEEGLAYSDALPRQRTGGFFTR